ncbi:CoA transferase [Sediminicoccus sp. KRV36]|uniref:CaiB/BaiF CoA transferase family protein n=1 Tax=Sediminicoccus sp. KRV36 TaxID=3133721 RepID=UPI00200C0645|nr:CoA transferase [Sediminicoccus rosea]UPY37382.1 CoA transferase [Sediminicoccus rosea]
MSTPKDGPKPYEGIFVLDAAQGIAGPYCGMLLAQSGATVIKLEPPKGDWSRGLTTRAGSHSVMHTAFNRGKRGVVLDLATDEGRARAAKLAAKADVLIEAFRPGVAARIGLGPEAAKPDAVCVSVSGFGQSGPYRERPCTDGIAQAFSGLVSVNAGADGVPHKTGTLVVDIVTGISAFAACQAALAERAQDAAAGRPGRRRHLDVSLMQTAASLLVLPIAEAGLLGRMPGELNVPAGSYPTKDGAWVMFALVREEEWVTLCKQLGREDLLSDPRFTDFKARFANKPALVAILRELFLTRDAAHWVELLQAARLLCDRVNTPLEFLEDPHVKAVRAAPLLHQPELGALPFPAIPGLGAWEEPAPALGAETEALFAEWGI